MVVRLVLTGLLCVAITVGVVYGLVGLPDGVLSGTVHGPTGKTAATGPSKGRQDDGAAGLYLDPSGFDDGGFSEAAAYTGEVRDPSSLAALREALRGRGRRGVAAVRADLEELKLDEPPTKEQLGRAGDLRRRLGLLYMYEGKFPEAAEELERALEHYKAAGLPDELRRLLTVMLGVVALRRGEVENCLECVGPSSCILPIDRAAVHRNQAGSREAVRRFTAYLDEQPGDLRVRWLLNIGHMTLGEYPDRVPRKYLLPLDGFASTADVGRFANVASRAGLTSRGPNLAGGSAFDDFDGDGRPDLLTTSLDPDLGASFFHNNGDGTFADHTPGAGLGDQVYALNVRQADIDNDGDLDVLLLRGGWEWPMRLSLLRNDGRGHFEDITLAAGLGVPIATESAAWGDFDNDGLIDLYVCGEYLPPTSRTISGSRPPDPRNRGRLYHNLGGCKFEDVAAKAGVLNERCGKGVAWGDYDDDGRLDLFVSNMRQPCRLYHNEGDGTFVDVAEKLGVTGPGVAFACWFWDFDNDGKLDLFVNDYHAGLAEVVADLMGAKVRGASLPALYKNLGRDGFRDVAAAAGLDRPIAPMGVNFADVDNDGFLDIYFGTGWMSYSGLVPNILLKNVEGERFDDATASSGTGHLQKGHGVSFADYDGDGDLDLFVELGGGVPGDQAYNALFRNPGRGNHWLQVKLVGTKTNRAALGAKVRVDLDGPGGESRTVFRTIGNNSSFGGNGLAETIGLGQAARVARLTVTWPVSRTTQEFHDLPADRALVITEGEDEYRAQDLPTPPR
jgi:hypothetical protein